LNRGGCITDRVTGEVIGNPMGSQFDLVSFRGGPLFHLADTLPLEHLFIGHSVCPGFEAIVDRHAWWRQTEFHVPGYDYFRQGFDYQFTPVALADYENTPTNIAELEAAPWSASGMRMALVYRNPLDQAASFYHYCCSHENPAYSEVNGGRLAGIPFEDYLFHFALPSYAKLFVSYEAMARCLPTQVRLMTYSRLMGSQAQAIGELLSHFSNGVPVDSTRIETAAHLARPAHLRQIEAELGRPLDGLQVAGATHMRRGTHWRGLYDGATQAQAKRYLSSLGIDTKLIDWPLAEDFSRRSRYGDKALLDVRQRRGIGEAGRCPP